MVQRLEFKVHGLKIMAKAAQFESEAFVGQKPDMTPSLAHLSMTDDMRGSTQSLNKRSMVFDEDRFESQFLRCGICKERFSGLELPRMLPCHHSFCQKCIDQIFMLAKDQKTNFPSAVRSLPLYAPPGAVNITCPVCRSNIIVTQDMMRKLPTDHRIVQLMDFVRHTDHVTMTFCSKHSTQALNFFCELCIQPICRDCTALEHKETEGHTFVDLQEALAKYNPILDNAVTAMDAESICLAEKTMALESVMNTLEQNKLDLLGQVRSCMSRMRDLLNEREKALVARVHQETGMERCKLVEKSQQLEDRRRLLIEKSSKLKHAKDHNLVEDMFRIHQEVRQCHEEPRLRVREVDDGLMTVFLLNNRDEATLASRINNFGDVACKIETTSSRLKTRGKGSLYRSSSFR